MMNLEVSSCYNSLTKFALCCITPCSFKYTSPYFRVQGENDKLNFLEAIHNWIFNVTPSTPLAHEQIPVCKTETTTQINGSRGKEQYNYANMQTLLTATAQCIRLYCMRRFDFLNNSHAS